MFDNDIVYTNTSGTVALFEGTDADEKSEYFVKKDDRNVIRLTPSSSNLAAGVYLNFPVPRSLNTTVTAADAPAGTSITITGHGPVVGDPLTFTTSAGATLDSTLTSGTEVLRVSCGREHNHSCGYCWRAASYVAARLTT
eukprot:TRINITY_DN2174_c0_g1_i1.p1 TRINITY_DN2174_c0_g1~~TRINITY_DN2174_c0_g1_i1.p1  ORF type:complete len:162 (-),score=49.78 TRINITY_DN2174_c0_g1_i1:4-423(-)